MKISSDLHLYLAYLLPLTFGFNFAAPFMLGFLHISLFQFLILFGISFLLAMLIVPRIDTIRTNASFKITALLLFLEAAGLLLAVYWWPFILLFAISFGFIMRYFWVPYNGMFFKQQEHQNNAKRSADYSAILNIFAIFMPIIAGILVQATDYTFLFAGTFLLVIPFALISLKHQDKKIEVHFRTTFKHALGYRTLVLLEGFLSILPFVTIPALTVLYFPKPQDFGLLQALFSVVALSAMIILSKISDAKNQRKKYLAPLSILTGVSIVLLALSKNPLEWAVTASIFSFVNTLASPLRTAIVLDKKTPSEIALANREFLLNAGRFAAILVSIAILWFGEAQFILLPAALSALVYAAVLYIKKWVT